MFRDLREIFRAKSSEDHEAFRRNVEMNRKAASGFLAAMPYGVMLRTVLEAIEKRTDATTMVTREFANRLDRWCDVQEREAVRKAGIRAPLTFSPPQDMQIHFTALGWTYRTDDEHSDSEVRKWGHWATQGNFAHRLDWSPYQVMTPAQFRVAIQNAQLV